MHDRMLLPVIAAWLYINAPAFAGDAVNYNESTLTGDWGGARSSLANSGVTVDIVYKFDVMANADGGIDEGARALDNLDVIFSLDGEKLLGAKGASGRIYLLNNNGRRPDASLVGSAQGIDNIEVAEPTGKLYEAWLQQNLFDDRLSVLGGLYDLNSEFYVTDSSGLFIHSTYGIGTDFAQSGLNGPSIFPSTSLGVRVKIQPAQKLYLQAAVFDGAPGSPDDLDGAQIEFNSGEGALFVAEMGFTPGGETPNGKLALGAWVYSDKFPDQIDVDANGNPLKQRSQGVYLIGERKIFTPAGGEDKGLSIFGRFGVAGDQVNQFDYAWSAGLVYTGLIPSRDAGQLGLGVGGAHNSSKFNAASVAAATPVDHAETAIELTYSDNLTPWFSIQPDIQYIINPGANPALVNAVVTGVRMAVSF